METSSQALLVVIGPDGLARVDDLSGKQDQWPPFDQLAETDACQGRVQAAQPTSSIPDSTGPVTPDEAVIYFSGGKDRDIWTVHADGSSLTDLTPGPQWDQGLDGSPDGAEIAFDRLGNGDAVDVFVVRTDGGPPELFESGAWSPAWSPDGKWLAMPKGARPFESGALTLVSSDRTQKRTLADRGGGPVYWSPDGSWIAFEVPTEATAQGELWVVRPDGSGLRQLTDLTDRGRFASWSPDNQHIAWSSFVQEGVPRSQDAMVVFDVNDGTHTLLPGASGLDRLLPAWSPRGDMVAYAEFAGDAAPNRSVIAIVDLKSERVSQMTDPPSDVGDGDPVWSPDGSRLLFLRQAGSEFAEIWTVPATGGGARFVTTGAYSAGWLK
jgi:Tol biopolymer transport system component